MLIEGTAHRSGPWSGSGQKFESSVCLPVLRHCPVPGEVPNTEKRGGDDSQLVVGT